MSSHAHEKKLLGMPLLAQQRLTRRLVTCRSCSRFKVYHTLDEPEHAHLKCVCCLQSSSCRVRREAWRAVVTHTSSSAVECFDSFCIARASVAAKKSHFRVRHFGGVITFTVQTHFSQRPHTRATRDSRQLSTALSVGQTCQRWVVKKSSKLAIWHLKSRKFSGLAGADGHRVPELSAGGAAAGPRPARKNSISVKRAT